uniref:N-glycosylase/DNA lyase n=1 Tax=Hirondellea gigas TaxID=1518452 RepID=A0A6A7G512_9CRUS
MASLQSFMIKLPCSVKELCLDITLQCGQSFRWKKTPTGKWTGMIHKTVWTLSQDLENIYCVLHNYSQKDDYEIICETKDTLNSNSMQEQNSTIKGKRRPNSKQISFVDQKTYKRKKQKIDENQMCKLEVKEEVAGSVPVNVKSETTFPHNADVHNCQGLTRRSQSKKRPETLEESQNTTKEFNKDCRLQHAGDSLISSIKSEETCEVFDTKDKDNVSTILKPVLAISDLVDSCKEDLKDFTSSEYCNPPPKILEYYTQLLKSYFRLDVSLQDLYAEWSEKDPNFARVAPSFPGVRMLDQPPVENVFSFICSSNNNINRISQLVEKLCIHFGDVECEVDGKVWHSFPRVEQLCSSGIEAKLRDLGFGYRASYISQSALFLSSCGEEAWLNSLKLLPYEECHQQLLKLTGVGPKVADCISLMSLDHLGSIPVDTHVFQIAARDYLPELRTCKTVTAKVYAKISEHFRHLYGPYAGWAHSVLFSADLKKFSSAKQKTGEQKKGKKKQQSKV